MKVQRFYKRGDKSVYYDIPYADDDYILYTEGSPIVTESLPNYVLSTGATGTKSTPDGMRLSKFLSQFKTDMSTVTSYDYVFPLEGTNGGSVTIDGVRYDTPVISIRHSANYEWLVTFYYGYEVSYSIISGFGYSGTTTGNTYEVEFKPYIFPENLPDKTIYNISCETYLITRRSITDTVKRIGENNGNITDNDFYFRTNYLDCGINVTSDDSTVSGIAYYISRCGDYTAGGSQFSSYFDLDKDRANNILNGITYDDVSVDDDEGTYDGDDGDGGTGTGKVPTGEDIDEPDKPGKNGASTGLLRGYVLTQAQTTTFSNWLWSSDVIDYISKLFTSNPLDSIITFSMLPYTPHTGTSTNIVVGGKACTDVSDALLIDEQFNTFEFTYNGLAEPVWGNALDYEKGVKIELFIPFVGIVPLDVNSVIYTKLKLKYIIDCFSGQGIVYLVSEKSASTWDDERKKCLLGQWTFNCKSTLPLTRNDISAIIGGAIGGITSLATGNIGGVASAVMSARPSVQRSGDVATSTAYMGKRNPYIIYTMTKAVIPKGEYGKKGRPQYAVKKVGDCDGFIQCDNPRLSFNGVDGQFPTDEEIKEIYSLLKEGVVV